MMSDGRRASGMSRWDDAIEHLHRDAPLTDVHVHPSLKAYLCKILGGNAHRVLEAGWHA